MLRNGTGTFPLTDHSAAHVSRHIPKNLPQRNPSPCVTPSGNVSDDTGRVWVCPHIVVNHAQITRDKCGSFEEISRPSSPYKICD